MNENDQRHSRTLSRLKMSNQHSEKRKNEQHTCEKEPWVVANNFQLMETESFADWVQDRLVEQDHEAATTRVKMSTCTTEVRREAKLNINLRAGGLAGGSGGTRWPKTKIWITTHI